MIDEGIDGWRRFLYDERAELSAHLADSFKNGDFETGVEEVTFSIGDAVRILADDFKGQEGEIACIERDALTGTMYGVYLDSLDNIGMFGADEIERIERQDDND